MTHSIEELRSVFGYEPEAGAVYRLDTGARVGAKRPDGGFQVSYKRKLYLTHRLAWALVRGVWPNDQIDHINGDRADNRLANLRDVDHKTNMENKRRAERGCESGVLGVRKQKNRYVARINHNRKTHYIGLFKTLEEASEAYLNTKRQLHAGCTI